MLVWRGEGEGLIVSPSSNSTTCDVFGFVTFNDRKKVAGTDFELFGCLIVSIVGLSFLISGVLLESDG